MGRKRKRASGGRRRIIKLKWKNRTVIEKQCELEQKEGTTVESKVHKGRLPGPNLKTSERGGVISDPKKMLQILVLQTSTFHGKILGKSATLFSKNWVGQSNPAVQF